MENSPVQRLIAKEEARLDALHKTLEGLRAQAKELDERFQAIDDVLRWMQLALQERKPADKC